MKKVQLLSYTLLLLFFAQFGFAQKVRWGPEQKKSKRIQSLSDIVVVNDNGIYAIATNSKGYHLQLYGENFALKKEVEIELAYNKKKLDYYSTIVVNDKIYAMGTFENSKLKKRFIFAQEIDQKTLKPTGSLIKLAEVASRNRPIFTYSLNPNTGGFFFKLSDDEKKLMFIANPPNKKSENENFEIYVFDENLKQVWQKEVTLPYEEKLFGIATWTLGNNGDVHILGKKYEGKKPKSSKDGKPNYAYKVLSYRNNGKDYKEYTIKKKDKFIHDLAFKLDAKYNLVCAGFYSENNTSGIIGTYFMTIDAETQSIIKQGEKQFDDDFLREFMTRREKKKDDKGKDVDKELHSFDLDKFILREDGGAVLLAEQFYITTTQYRDSNGNWYTRTIYHYDNIMAVNINPDGSIAWASKIEKSQRGANSYYFSYAYVINDDKVHILFNEWENAKRSFVSHVTVDKDGKVQKKTLIYQDKREVLLVPSSCEQIDSKELIIYADYKKAFKLGLVSY